ncbi:hypothetical protein [Anaerotruncus colihominis]|uniref:hypothetical protein n=1 Tax=Anaerotruncus colihominis TaxID=169435 RepID=UPI0029433CC2|nr:hypothetical protein [Anaerotruncus colihominis]
MASDTNLEKLVRLGTVTAVDAGKRQARVKYEDTGLPSGWLYVLAAPPSVPDYDAPQRTELEAGGSGEAAYESHSHELIIKPWMPKVNETVLILYLPGDNTDGFVLGRV